MPTSFLTRTETKTSQLTLADSESVSSAPETCQDGVSKARRYEFARGFIADTTTILDPDTRRAVYHLSGFHSTQKSTRSTPVCLRNAHTLEVMATIQPRRLFTDVITFHSPALNVSKKIQVGWFGRTRHLFRVSGNGSLSMVNIPNPGGLGLPKGARLFWKIPPDKRSMTLHSVTDDKRGISSILAYASFAQSTASGRLVSIEVMGDMTETLLVYTFISASIMEARVHKEYQKEQERLYLQHATAYPVWTIAPFGASCFFL